MSAAEEHLMEWIRKKNERIDGMCPPCCDLVARLHQEMQFQKTGASFTCGRLPRAVGVLRHPDLEPYAPAFNSGLDNRDTGYPEYLPG